MIKYLWIAWAALPTVILGYAIGWKFMALGAASALVFLSWSRVLMWLSEKAKL